jgi:hypothetical protein
MKKIFMLIFITLCNFFFQYASAASSPLFTLAVSGNILKINTKTPGWFYQYAGIKFITPEYSIIGKVPQPENGYYLFSVSDTYPAVLKIKGPAGTARIIVCLNGVGDTYSCEQYPITISNFPTITSVDLVPVGDKVSVTVHGINFVPGLGSAGPTSIEVWGYQPSSGICTAADLPHFGDGLFMLSNNSITITAQLPTSNICIAFCNVSVQSSTFPGQTANCTNMYHIA